MVAFLCFSFAAAPLAASTVIRHAPRLAPVIALTFDDGYSPARVRQILAILQANGVPATFFPYANAVRSAPATWRTVAAAGYPIGNHSVSHPRLTSLSTTSISYQVCGFRSAVDPIIGQASIDWFRPPYGRWDSRVAAAGAACGYPHMLLWDVDTRDWDRSSPWTIASRALSGSDGSIVLMHAGPANTPFALQRIIDGYRKRGFRFVTIPELVGATDIPSAQPVFESRD
ncbi:MAG: polysaccharide deacetylase family protein [Candidatus Limnocylindrales bacterium]